MVQETVAITHKCTYTVIDRHISNPINYMLRNFIYIVNSIRQDMQYSEKKHINLSVDSYKITLLTVVLSRYPTDEIFR